MASAQSLAPHSGVSDAITLAVTRAIKPELNYGELVASLLANKNTSDDRKVYLLLSEPGALARGMLFAADAVDATVLATETLVGSIVRDDATKETSSHTFTVNGTPSGEAAEMQARIEALLGRQVDEGNLVFGAKPSRSLLALVNAICDQFEKTLSDGFADRDAITHAFAISFDQTGDGVLKVWDGATAGTLTGKLADVDMVEDSTPSVDSLW